MRQLAAMSTPLPVQIPNAPQAPFVLGTTAGPRAPSRLAPAYKPELSLKQKMEKKWKEKKRRIQNEKARKVRNTRATTPLRASI
jgi:hypothetical protein